MGYPASSSATVSDRSHNLGRGWTPTLRAGLRLPCRIITIRDAALVATAASSCPGVGTALAPAWSHGVIVPMRPRTFRTEDLRNYVGRAPGARGHQPLARRGTRVRRLVSGFHPEMSCWAGGTRGRSRAAPRCRIGANAMRFRRVPSVGKRARRSPRLSQVREGEAGGQDRQERRRQARDAQAQGDLREEEAMTPTSLTARPAWQALRAHYQAVASRTLKDLFAADPSRGTRLTLDAAGIYLDYSKNRSPTRREASRGARPRLLRAIDRACSWRPDHVSENRAVLHVALRAPKDERSPRRPTCDPRPRGAGRGCRPSPNAFA